ncbi:MAG: hypothetical protein ACI8PZ_004069 [Myxococcota bacterium]
MHDLERMTGSIELGPAGRVPFSQFQVEADLGCQATAWPDGRAALQCTVGDADVASLEGTGAADLAIVDAVATRFAQAEVTLSLSPVGRLRGVDVELPGPGDELGTTPQSRARTRLSLKLKILGGAGAAVRVGVGWLAEGH